MAEIEGTTRREMLDRGAMVTVGAMAGAAMSASGAQARPGSGGPVSVQSVSLDQALRVIRAGRRRARQLGVAMMIVVVDSSGVEKASERMDGNSQASPTLAPLKAQTANAFRTATDVLAAGVTDPGDPARLASIAAAPGFTLLGGGVPLRSDGAVIGAVGVGGGTPDQDVAVAQAAADALE